MDWLEEKELVLEQAHKALKPGDGITIHIGSDAEAFTVIRRTPCMIVAQRDKATLSSDFNPQFSTGGFVAHCWNNDDQKWEYEKDENGYVIKIYYSKSYKRFMYLQRPISVGRHEFYDYNF